MDQVQINEEQRFACRRIFLHHMLIPDFVIKRLTGHFIPPFSPVYQHGQRISASVLECKTTLRNTQRRLTLIRGPVGHSIG
jgi:hypothetical protein